MRVSEILYFSKKYKFSDLKWDNKEILINAFKDRVKEFYIEPAKKLNDAEYGFGAGVLCVTTIDFLARIKTGLLNGVGKRFENWLRDNIKEFAIQDPASQSQTLASRFYNEFRNGLVHEG